MFCLTCGAEGTGAAVACPVCGQPSSVPGEPATTERTQAPALDDAPSTGLHFTPTTSATIRPLPASAASASLPRTSARAERELSLVLTTTAVALAVDVLVPWMDAGTTRVPLVRAGTAVWFLLLALAAVVFVTMRVGLRHHAVWSALPFALGVFLLGAALTLWTMLPRLGPAPTSISTIVRSSTGSADTPPPLIGWHGAVSVIATSTYTPDVGLYTFIGGSAILAFAGFLLLRRAPAPAIRTVSSAAAAVAPIPVAPGTAAVLPAVFASASAAAPGARGQPERVEFRAASRDPAAPSAGRAETPTAPTLPPGVVLPGTPAWNQPHDRPLRLRHATVA